MKLSEIIAIARRQAQDVALPYLWSNDDWIDYANEAQREACRRAHLLIDSETEEICSFTVASGDFTIDRDPRVIRIRRVKLASKTAPLTSIDYRDLDASNPGWETATGTVEYWVRNYQSNKVRFYKGFSAADTVTLTVVRLPLEDMGVNDEPEIPAVHHRKLVNGMLELAYLKDDEETLNPKKSEAAGLRFARDFGFPQSAKDEAWNEENMDYADGHGEF